MSDSEPGKSTSDKITNKYNICTHKTYANSFMQIFIDPQNGVLKYDLTFDITLTMSNLKKN